VFSNELSVLLAPFLAAQRWYAAVARPQLHVRRVDTLLDGWPSLLWVLVEVRGESSGAGPADWYQLLLGATSEEPVGLPPASRLGSMPTPRGRAHLFDALADEELALELCRLIAPRIQPETVRLQPGELTNTSLVVNESHIVKVFRRLQRGPNPDVEVTEALGRVGYGGAPVPVTVWRRAGTDLAVVRRYERSRGVGSDLALDSLREMFNLRRAPRDGKLDFVEEAQELGNEVARLHVALAEAFGAEEARGGEWAEDLAAQLHRVSTRHLDTTRIEGVYRRLEAADDLGAAIRIHGNLALGEVIRLQRNWMVLDFEGEAARPVEERRRPSSPLRDVAGMTRSFHHVASAALREVEVPDDELRLLADAWSERNVNAFLSGYASEDDVHRLLPRTRASRDALLSVFELDRAVYEVVFELAHGPELSDQPVRAVERLLADDGEGFDPPPGASG
jgi:maltokinase